MTKIRTLNLKEQISNTYNFMLNARKIGSDSLYDIAFKEYQGLLAEFLENIQRENEAILLQIAENQKILDENQKLINFEIKYKNCLHVIR